MDVVTAVRNDYQVLDGLFAQLATGQERPALLAEIRARLLAHAKAAEKHVYPAAARSGDRALARHHVNEHQGALEALTAVESAGPEDFSGRLSALVRAVREQERQLENDVLPAIGAAVSSRKREDLGRAFEAQRLRELKRNGFDDALTKEDLYIRAQKAGIPGRSSMSKSELARALLAVKTGRTSSPGR
ncbi:MAG: hemerythrin domain-containing protein [Labedaea sp.]